MGLTCSLNLLITVPNTKQNGPVGVLCNNVNLETFHVGDSVYFKISRSNLRTNEDLSGFLFMEFCFCFPGV